MAARQVMTRPPPNGTPAQSDRTSGPQTCTIASASRGRSVGIGPMGATAGAAAAGAPDGAAAPGTTTAAAAAANRRHGAATRRRQLRFVALETLQRFGAAGLHAGAMGHEIGPARRADGGFLLIRGRRRGGWRGPVPVAWALPAFWPVPPAALAQQQPAMVPQQPAAKPEAIAPQLGS
ncbi:MAG TPA: hypothetical protein VNZ48_19255 [Xanthobacteraceae bacterium]|nr:hypothetical protein [Xanthobacteraceae bacterium]